MKRKEKKEEESEEILSSAYEEEEGGVIEEGEEEGREEGEEGVEMEEGEDNSVIQFSGGGERTKRIVQGCLTLIVVVYFLCGLLLYVFQGLFCSYHKKYTHSLITKPPTNPPPSLPFPPLLSPLLSSLLFSSSPLPFSFPLPSVSPPPQETSFSQEHGSQTLLQKGLVFKS